MPYYCPTCDVYGAACRTEAGCWMCGSAAVVWGISVPAHGGHRHDPRAVTAILAGQPIPIEVEAHFHV